MKKTLLQLVQEILSDMDGDEVNSYADTTESLQVANIIQKAYLDIVSTSSFPKMFTPFELEASSNPAEPCIMELPDDRLTVAWLRYDASTLDNPDAGYRQLEFMPFEEYVNRMYALDATDTNVVSFEYTFDNGDTLNVRCRNDNPPSVYTTINDHVLLFDSYDSDVDSALQANKTIAFGEKLPTFTMSDSFIPDLPDKQFTILRNEAKAAAFATLKQTTNANAERKARRGWVTSQKTGRRVNNPRTETHYTPNYARR